MPRAKLMAGVAIAMVVISIIRKRRRKRRRQRRQRKMWVKKLPLVSPNEAESIYSDNDYEQSSATTSSATESTASGVTNPSKKRKRIDFDNEERLLKKACRILATATSSKNDDELSVFGEFVASRLKTLDADLRSSAMRKIQEALLDAEDTQADRTATSFTPLTISPVNIVDEEYVYDSQCNDLF